MTNPTVREFLAADLDALENRDGQQSNPELTVLQSMRGPAFTAVADGRVIGCGGVAVLWEGFGACWMILADDIGSHGLWLSKTTMQFLQNVKRDLRLHRLEATALHESVRNQKWLELCGFTREQNGVAQQYLADRRSIVRYEIVEDACKP